MYQIILILHVFVAIALIGMILLQQGKGAEVGAAFGSGSSQTVFGSQGSSAFLFKLTAGLATVFFITSLTLGYLVSHQAKNQQTLFSGLETPAPTSAPFTPVKTNAPEKKSEITLPPQKTENSAPSIEKGPVKNTSEKSVKKQ